MNNDLISRSALKEQFFGDYDGKTYFTNEVLNIIDNAPTVELNDMTAYFNGFEMAKQIHERPQGEWKFIQGATTQGSLKCPFCNYRDYHKTNSNFCPNCGARMRKGGKE